MTTLLNSRVARLTLGAAAAARSVIHAIVHARSTKFLCLDLCALHMSSLSDRSRFQAVAGP